MEFLTSIAGVAGYVITIITLITLIVKPLRQRFVEMVISKQKDKKQDEILTELATTIKEILLMLNEQSDEMSTLKSALQCSIRNTITHLYYKYTSEGKIPPLEKENINFLFQAYQQTDGNSYVESCVEELRKLPMK